LDTAKQGVVPAAAPSLLQSEAVTRRACLATLAAAGMPGCISRALRESDDAATARLRSRPGKAAGNRPPGLHSLKLRRERDTLLYIPKSAAPDRASPLVLYLHGATGSEQQGIKRLSSLSDQLGFVLLSPASEETTWDAIQSGYGRDFRLIDNALAATFESCSIDPDRIAVSGFSDGASYALGLGLSNGELFGSVAAFSPGFIPPGTSLSGKPRIFISHGRDDSILPIDSSSRRLVPELKRAGYNVTFREFDGPHAVPPEIAAEAMRWFVG
jgi:predicted esterase